MSNRIFSKVILSGEHSVLRGGYAVVAPNKNYFLEYDLKKAKAFSLKLAEDIKPYELLFLGLIESALSLSNSTIEDLKVEVKVSSLVPLGEGLGGSAALCVFVSRLFLFTNILKDTEIFPFAHEIENVFHGQSSGLDVAGCMSDQIILYRRGVKKIQELNLELKSYSFTIHQTGERGETKDCIEQVLKLGEKNKDLFNSLDDRMSEASLQIKNGIEQNEADLILQSFIETTEIFQSWGLIPQSIKEKMTDLENMGALAVRLTGSGRGGCLVAFWKENILPEKYNESIFLKK